MNFKNKYSSSFLFRLFLRKRGLLRRRQTPQDSAQLSKEGHRESGGLPLSPRMPSLWHAYRARGSVQAHALSMWQGILLYLFEAETRDILAVWQLQRSMHRGTSADQDPWRG